jgi:ribosome-dependent ATPase
MVSAVSGDGKGPVVSIKDVTHRYGSVVALDGISLDIPSGRMVGIIGPDGVGKSTLMALIAGSKKMQKGTMIVPGWGHRRCPASARCARGSPTCRRVWARTSTWNSASTRTSTSWPDSSDCPSAERPIRVKELLDATGLGPFPERPAGKLSGGMKQKVGLCGALVHEPDLLILDEPTTGVDPLSRRQFWTLIDDIRADRPGMSVVISTAYMDEAQQWDWIVAMDAGRVLATGTPAELMERTGTKDLEKCFIKLLPEENAWATRS